jgi:small subunit ribosomal protein S17
MAEDAAIPPEDEAEGQDTVLAQETAAGEGQTTAADPPAEPVEPAEVPGAAQPAGPAERRRSVRAAKAAATAARPPRTPEERQAERAQERRRKAAVRARQRRRRREKARAERAGTAAQPAAPLRERRAGVRKTRQGVVISDRASKTITVRIDVARRHRRYEKIVRTWTTLHAHDEHEDAHVGDTVIVRESRPLSATKRWRLVKVVERAR